MATVESPQPQNAVADFVECCLWRLSAGVIWYLPVAVLLYTATGESLLPFSMWLLLFPLAAMFWNVKRKGWRWAALHLPYVFLGFPVVLSLFIVSKVKYLGRNVGAVVEPVTRPLSALTLAILLPFDWLFLLRVHGQIALGCCLVMLVALNTLVICAGLRVAS